MDGIECSEALREQFVLADQGSRPVEPWRLAAIQLVVAEIEPEQPDAPRPRAV
ncbi:hypothetical protein [Kitasatospora sp. NPDC059327]|uniref:hypothetical protein n=1 Tax=Kitasatospora sp. NPDC059327 TaxID=3346803 RepID=UPI0036C5C239